VVATPVTDKDATGHNILGVCSIAPHVARENSNESIRAQQRPHGDRYHAARLSSLVRRATGEGSLRANGCSNLQDGVNWDNQYKQVDSVVLLVNFKNILVNTKHLKVR